MSVRQARGTQNEAGSVHRKWHGLLACKTRLLCARKTRRTKQDENRANRDALRSMKQIKWFILHTSTESSSMTWST